MTCNSGYQSKHHNGCVSKITRKVGRLAGLANQLYNKRNFQLWQKKEDYYEVLGVSKTATDAEIKKDLQTAGKEISS